MQYQYHNDTDDDDEISICNIQGSQQTCDAKFLNNRSPHSSIRTLSPPTNLASSEIKVSISLACNENLIFQYKHQKQNSANTSYYLNHFQHKLNYKSDNLNSRSGQHLSKLSIATLQDHTLSSTHQLLYFYYIEMNSLSVSLSVYLCVLHQNSVSSVEEVYIHNYACTCRIRTFNPCVGRLFYGNRAH